MRFPRLAVAALLAFTAAPFAFAQDDAAGSKDYPGISRMPGYYISHYEESPFDAHTFTVTERGAQKDLAVEGRRISIRYDLKENVEVPSQLQVLRNYQNAARAAGGQVLFGDEESTTLRFAKDGKETWCGLSVANRPSGVFVSMVIIEKQAMQQDVTIDAKALAVDIAASGRVAVYGIHFDTAQAVIKPESAPVLAEIAKMLQANPALKVYIVGHTDMAGDAAANLKLSQARAQAVVTALVSQHGIAAARLLPFGAGPFAPVATNKTEEGRARNRRVELVEIATK